MPDLYRFQPLPIPSSDVQEVVYIVLLLPLDDGLSLIPLTVRRRATGRMMTGLIHSFTFGLAFSELAAQRAMWSTFRVRPRKKKTGMLSRARLRSSHQISHPPARPSAFETATRPHDKWRSCATTLIRAPAQVTPIPFQHPIVLLFLCSRGGNCKAVRLH